VVYSRPARNRTPAASTSRSAANVFAIARDELAAPLAAPGAAPAVAAAAAKVSVVTSGTPSAAWPEPTFQDIPPPPIKRHHISDETAEQLATLPRKRLDEMAWAALGGAIAAAPSAVDAINTALNQSQFSLHAIGSVQIGIFLVFFVWFLSRIGIRSTKTSGDLLKKLRSTMEADR
jgi:hypothetical protein